jgi:hypothetical protein
MTEGTDLEGLLMGTRKSRNDQVQRYRVRLYEAGSGDRMEIRDK